MPHAMKHVSNTVTHTITYTMCTASEGMNRPSFVSSRVHKHKWTLNTHTHSPLVHRAPATHNPEAKWMLECRDVGASCACVIYELWILHYRITHTYIYIFITNEMYYNSVENGKKTKQKNSGRDACVFASPDGRKAIAVDVYFSSINFKSFWYNICLFVCLFIVQRCIYSMFPYFDEFIMYIRSEQRATWQNHTVLQLFLFLFFFLYLQIDWMAYWHMQCTLKQKQNIL